jgi:hypothetical protein
VEFVSDNARTTEFDYDAAAELFLPGGLISSLRPYDIRRFESANYPLGRRVHTTDRSNLTVIIQVIEQRSLSRAPRSCFECRSVMKMRVEQPPRADPHLTTRATSRDIGLQRFAGRVSRDTFGQRSA